MVFYFTGTGNGLYAAKQIEQICLSGSIRAADGKSVHTPGRAKIYDILTDCLQAIK